MNTAIKHNNGLGQTFTFWSLLRFALPTIIMMMVTGLYSVVDSVFVSRFVGTNALSAINIVYPFINVIYGFGIMLATGGSAVIAAKLGSGEKKEACGYLTAIVISGAVIGTLIGIFGLVFLDPIVRALGASEVLFEYCRTYLGILLAFAPMSMLQLLFQSYFVTAGRPGLGLFFTCGAGIINSVIDFVLIVPLKMGISGAAIGTAIGYMIPAIAGVLFFLIKDKPLHFSRPLFHIKTLLQCCSNGSSEMVSNISVGVVTFLFNMIMMNYLKEDGVAAVTIVMYAQFTMSSMYMGFSIGVAPVISFKYGEGSNEQIKKIFRSCVLFLSVAGVAVFMFAMLFGSLIVRIFAAPTSAVYQIAAHGFTIFPLCFLFEGFNIYASAMFTAFGNGKISAFLSFLRTFVFVIAGLLLLPLLMGVNGVWLAVPIAEFCAFIVAFICTNRHKKLYHLV